MTDLPDLNSAVEERARGLATASKGNLRPDEISFLRTIVKNSRFSIKPKSVNLAHPSRRPDAATPISFATVSTSLTFVPEFAKSGAQVHFKPIERGNGRFQLLTLDNNYSINEIKKFLLDTVLETGNALATFEQENRGAEFCKVAQRVIVLHEFGFPFPMEQDEIAEFLHDMEKAMQGDAGMRTFWENCYVVFGSYHCHRDIKNTAVISLPYSVNTKGFEASLDLKGFCDQILLGLGTRFNFTHDKFAPAERINERLIPRDRIDWYYYDTDIGRIGVLVCFDALDSRMLLRLAKLQLTDKDFNSQKFAMLVVPCFSPNDSVADSCRLLSSILDTTVIYANVIYPENSAAQGAPKSYRIRTPQDACDNTHGIYHRGENVTCGKGKAFSVSPVNKVTPEGVSDKNLWYITRFVCVDRHDIENNISREHSFDGLFQDIFS